MDNSSYNCALICNGSKIGSDLHRRVEPYTIYIIQGILFGACNIIIVATVAKHSVLRTRKEYFTVAALAFADVLNEICFLSAGIHRIRLILNGEDQNCTYAFECLMTLHDFIWTYSMPLVYFMLLCISIDRFLCVFTPLRYYTWELDYSFKLCGLFYFLPVPVMISSFVIAKMAIDSGVCPTHERICLLDEAIKPADNSTAFFYVNVVIQIGCSSASVLLYIAIPFIYKFQTRKLEQLGDRLSLIRLRAQKRLLVTLGMSSIGTFLFMVIPGIVRLIANNSNFEAFPLAGIVMNMNPIVNTFLFIFRHRMFREGVLALFRCRRLIPSASVQRRSNTVNISVINHITSRF